MSSKKLLLLLIIFLSADTFGQGFMTYLDGKKYQSTNSWDFICEKYALTGKTNIQIAKADKGGVMQISVDTTDPTFYIGGTIYVDLEDNSVIVCTDKNLRQATINRTTAWYIFTPSEMNKLKSTNISNVRFYIKGNQQKFSSQTGNFTAINKKAYFSTSEIKVEKFETAFEINSLYP
jgi:hypothetical protein